MSSWNINYSLRVRERYDKIILVEGCVCVFPLHPREAMYHLKKLVLVVRMFMALFSICMYAW